MDAHAAATPAPWYRHRWPWFLIAGPAVVVVAGAVTVWLAVRSYDGLVADDYYKQGLGINRTLARAERAAELAIVAEIVVGTDGAIEARIAGEGPLASPPQVQITFVRPARQSADVRVDLVRDRDGRYRGRVGALEAGRWQVVVETDAWRLPSIEASAPFAPLTLRAR